MSYHHEVQAVAQAIRDARRCPDYDAAGRNQCEGLDGCEWCLERAAKAALKAASVPR
jgi:hypothetical protein